MGFRLNGWRRMALASCVLWSLVAFGVAGWSFSQRAEGYFVYLTIPAGTVVFNRSIKSPAAVPLSTEQQKPESERTGHFVPDSDLPDGLKSWQIDGSKQSAAPTIPELRWGRLLLAGLAAPLLAWFTAEIAAAVVRWIGRGFKEEAS